MKHLEQLAEVLRELSDRYGVTITEVPDRLREKILNKVGAEASDELELLFKPLLQNCLRPLRIRAGQRVDRELVAQATKKTEELEGFNAELAKTIVDIWVAVFRIKAGESSAFSASKRPGPAKEPPVKDEKASQQLSSSIDNRTKKKKSHSVAQGDFSGKVSDAQNESPVDVFATLNFSSDAKEQKPREKPVEVPPAATSRQATSSATASSAKPEKRGRLDDGAIKPLQPDSMSFSAVVADSDSASRNKTTLDDAFRSLRQGNYTRASKLMMELARDGDTRAQYHLGEFYLAGTGVEQNQDKAKYWFRKAAAHGSMPARDKLKDLEEPDGQSGCLSCAFIFFLVIVFFRFLGSIF